MKYLLITIISLFSFSIFSQELSPKDFISLLLLNQEYEKAIHQCENILMYDSTATWAWAPMGQAKLKLLRYKDALNDFKEAEKHFPDNLSVKYSQGNAYSKLGDHAKASATCQSIIEKDSTQLLACIELAKSYYNGKKYSDALPVYQDLVKEDPRNYAFNKELGLTYLQLDSIKQALWYLHTAINMNNRDMNLVVRVATLYNKVEEYNSALDVVELGLLYNKAALPLLSLKGYCHYLLKYYSLSIRDFKNVMSLGDTSLFVKKYLGLSHLSIGQATEAVPFLLEVFRADTTHPNNCYNVGIAYHELPDYKVAIDYLSKTQELLKPNPYLAASIFRYMARCYYNLDDWDKSLNYYFSSFRLDPEDYTVLFNIGTLYDYKILNKKKALKYYQDYLKACGFPNEKGKNPPGVIYGQELANSRIKKIREDLHFEGKLKK